MSDSESRYELVSRRAMLKGSILFGTLALAPGLACSSSGNDVLATSSSTTTAAKANAPSTTTAATVTGPTLPTEGQLTVNFSFAPVAGGGRVNNPFVAVWIEDATGALLRTVSLWFKASESKYVNELRRWYSVDRARVAKGGADTMRTISGATRVAGTYSVTWDGKNNDGVLATQGNYFVCIEAAREHGPYELIRESITIGSTAFQKQLPPSGELTAASVAFVA